MNELKETKSLPLTFLSNAGIVCLKVNKQRVQPARLISAPSRLELLQELRKKSDSRHYVLFISFILIFQDE